MERGNEMRYANRLDPFEREAAQGAVQQIIAPVNVNREALIIQRHQNANGDIPPGNKGDALEALHNLVHPLNARKYAKKNACFLGKKIKKMGKKMDKMGK